MHQLANHMTATRPDPSVDLSELERDYIVKRELGEGGMGAVFLARHRTAGHDVAIKVISSKFIADTEALSRFEREARLMSRWSCSTFAASRSLPFSGDAASCVSMSAPRSSATLGWRWNTPTRTASSIATSSRTTSSSTPT